MAGAYATIKNEILIISVFGVEFGILHMTPNVLDIF